MYLSISLANGTLVGFSISRKRFMMGLRDQLVLLTLILDKGKTDENQ
jgi:uncharacterized protein YneF (UPF0154 family)